MSSTTTSNSSVCGRIQLKTNANETFQGDEILYIAVRDSLRYDAECIELGCRTIVLEKQQKFPIDFQCFYDPNLAHMKFDEIKTIPGGITLSATIERNGQLLFTNDTDLQLAEHVEITLVKI